METCLRADGCDGRVAVGNTGTDATVYGVTTDHEGNPRPRGAGYDMGAFEVQE